MTEPFTAGEPLSPNARHGRPAPAAPRTGEPARGPDRRKPRRSLRLAAAHRRRAARRSSVLAGRPAALPATSPTSSSAADLPDVDGLRNYQPPVMSRVYAGNSQLLAELATERRIFVPYAAIPDIVKQAFVSAEDQNFFTHPGVDPLAILRAGVTDACAIRARAAGRSAPRPSPSRSPRTCCWATRCR